MKYLVTPNAAALSRAEAARRGCRGTTTHWWAVLSHPTDGRTALALPDTEVPMGASAIDSLPADWSPPVQAPT